MTWLLPQEGVLLLLQQRPERCQLRSGVTPLSGFQLLAPASGQRAIPGPVLLVILILLVLLGQAQRVSYLSSDTQEQRYPQPSCRGRTLLSAPCGGFKVAHLTVADATYFQSGVGHHVQRGQLLHRVLLHDRNTSKFHIPVTFLTGEKEMIQQEKLTFDCSSQQYRGNTSFKSRNLGEGPPPGGRPSGLSSNFDIFTFTCEFPISHVNQIELDFLHVWITNNSAKKSAEI